MERPSVKTHDSSSRMLRRFDEDTEQKDRYYDRMTLRGIPILRDTDTQEETSIWRGDHTFNSDAASYSLTNFIIPEVTKQHPDWTKEQIDRVATQRFEERLAQDLLYEHKESSHEESVVHWQPIQTNEGSWELATQYGDSMVTLSQLWEHTREYAEFAGNPAAYNPDEHKAQLRMQEEIITGAANGFVSVLSHPDAIRYVQVWQKIDDGTIISKQVDLYKTTGRDFSHEEGAKLIDNLATYFKEDVGGGEASVISYAHIYIHEKEVQEDDIRTIAIAQAMEIQSNIESPVERNRPQIAMRTTGIVMRDTTESMYQLGAFLKVHIERKISALKQNDFSEVNPPAKIRSMFTRSINNVQAGKSEVNIRASAEKMQKRTTDMAHVTDVMKSMSAEWVIIRSMVQYKDIVPVASVALMYWITRPMNLQGVEVPTEKIEMHKHVEERPVEHTTMQRFGESLKHMFAFMRGDHATKQVSTIHQFESSHASSVKIETSVVEHSEHFHIPSSEVPQIHLSNSTAEGLLVVLHQLLVKQNGMSANETSIMTGDIPVQGISIHESLPDHELSIPLITRQLSIGIIVWLLIEHTRAISHPHEEVSEHTVVPGPVEDIQTDEQNASTPWLLLSIIWYLAAIREHGKHHVPPVKTTSKKQKQHHPVSYAVLPSSGIIFTFGS